MINVPSVPNLWVEQPCYHPNHSVFLARLDNQEGWSKFFQHAQADYVGLIPDAFHQHRIGQTEFRATKQNPDNLYLYYFEIPVSSHDGPQVVRLALYNSLLIGSNGKRKYYWELSEGNYREPLRLLNNKDDGERIPAGLRLACDLSLSLPDQFLRKPELTLYWKTIASEYINRDREVKNWNIFHRKER